MASWGGGRAGRPVFWFPSRRRLVGLLERHARLLWWAGVLLGTVALWWRAGW